jgi:hypothetical protein
VAPEVGQAPEAGFEQVVYLLASARMALDEPILYASFRLLEGASRTIDVHVGEDTFLDALRAEIEETKLRMIDDAPGYVDWLDDVLRRIVAEAKRRNASPGVETGGLSTS